MPGKWWKTREVVKLKKLLAQKVAVRHMRIGKRTIFGIREKATRLQLIGNGIYRRPWPAEDEAKLRRLVAEKMPVRQMVMMEGGLTGYTPGAVVTKISRLHLADKERSQYVRAAVRLKKDQLPVFHEFLSLLVTVCPPEQIAKLWNERHEPKVTTHKVLYHLTYVLRINRPRNEVLAMQYSKDKRTHRSQKVIKVQHKRWKKFREKMKKKFARLAKEVRSVPRNQRVPERVCSVCRKKWPVSKPFFRSWKNWTRKGWSVNFKYICRLCDNEKIREAKKVKTEKLQMRRQA